MNIIKRLLQLEKEVKQIRYILGTDEPIYNLRDQLLFKGFVKTQNIGEDRYCLLLPELKRELSFYFDNKIKVKGLEFYTDKPPVYLFEFNFNEATDSIDRCVEYLKTYKNLS